MVTQGRPDLVNSIWAGFLAESIGKLLYRHAEWEESQQIFWVFMASPSAVHSLGREVPLGRYILVRPWGC